MSFSLLQFCAFIFSVLFTSSLIYSIVYNKSSNYYGEVLYEFPIGKFPVLIFIILFSLISFCFFKIIIPVASSFTILLLCWFFSVSFLLCLDKYSEHLIITTNGVGYKTWITGIQKDDFIEWNNIENWNFEDNEQDILHLKLPDDCITTDKYLFVPKDNQNVITSLFNMFCH